MTGIVLVSHGRLASEMLLTAELIVGPVEKAGAVDIPPGASMDEVSRMIEEAVSACDDGDGVLLMTDMFGGTPSNVGLSFLGHRTLEVVTGFNLPMVVKLPAARKTMGLSDLVHFIRDYGQRNITVPGDMLRPGAVQTTGTTKG